MYNSNKLNDAINNLKKVLELDTKHMGALFLIGKANFKQENFVSAIKNFSELLDVDPKNSEALKYRGISFAYTDKIDQSINDLSNNRDIEKNIVKKTPTRTISREIEKGIRHITLCRDNETKVA